MKPLLLFLALTFCACASTNTSVYDKGGLEKISLWAVDFTYEARLEQRTASNSGVAEVSQMNLGRSQMELQLRDDIFFALQDEHGIPVTQDVSKASGIIKLAPHHDRFWRTVDVQLVDHQGKVLARVRVENGDRNATVKDSYSFARYAAEAIGKAIRK